VTTATGKSICAYGECTNALHGRPPRSDLARFCSLQCEALDLIEHPKPPKPDPLLVFETVCTICGGDRKTYRRTKDQAEQLRFIPPCSRCGGFVMLEQPGR
jgi:hypothetical protein